MAKVSYLTVIITFFKYSQYQHPQRNSRVLCCLAEFRIEISLPQDQWNCLGRSVGQGIKGGSRKIWYFVKWGSLIIKVSFLILVINFNLLDSLTEVYQLSWWQRRDTFLPWGHLTSSHILTATWFWRQHLPRDVIIIHRYFLQR